MNKPIASLQNFSDSEWLEFLIEVGQAYKTRYNRKLSITDEIGELIVCSKLKLTRQLEGNAGFDALDLDGKQVQIKSRAPGAGKKTVSEVGRVGRFVSWQFDYAVLVIFDERYVIQSIWKTDVADVQKLQEKVKNPKVGISVRNFKKVASQISLD